MDISYYKKFEPIDGKWYIVKELGSGAFGTVFEVERRDFSQAKSALKIITIPSSSNEVNSYREDNYDLDEKSISSYFYGFVEEFTDEFKLMTKLRGNSNIVSIEDYDVIEHKDEIGWDIFIRMELLTPMNKYFRDHELSQRDIIKLGIDICKALEVCQKYKIIHRDIKPSNIFVSDTGEFKLGDFGIARTLEKTSSGLSKKGTYTYMAPEVHVGSEYGSNVDIYSLGIVMYKLLNNNFEPFRTQRTHNDEEEALTRRLKGEKIPKPANADGRLAEIVLKACSFNPKERYESPLRMREELENILYNESEAKVIYPNGDEVEYEASINGSTNEKTVSMFGNFTVADVEEEYNKTVSIFDGEVITPEESVEVKEKTISDNKSENDIYHMVQENCENKNDNKGKIKGILIGAMVFIIIAIMAFGIYENKNTNNYGNEVIPDVLALIEITDEEDNVILNNKEITYVKKCYDDELGYYLTLGLNEEGKAKFYEYTSEHIGEVARIYINKMRISAPNIFTAINTDDVLITGEFTKDDINGWVESLQTEYITEETQEETTEDVNSTEESVNETQETISVQTGAEKTAEQASGKSKTEKTEITKKCNVCGSTAHTTHPTCPVCGSTSHTSHPTCSVCGSTSHTVHPTCPVCGSTSHSSHPQETKESTVCTICGSKYHDESVHSGSDAPIINKEFD